MHPCWPSGATCEKTRSASASVKCSSRRKQCLQSCLKPTASMPRLPWPEARPAPQNAAKVSAKRPRSSGKPQLLRPRSRLLSRLAGTTAAVSMRSEAGKDSMLTWFERGGAALGSAIPAERVAERERRNKAIAGGPAMVCKGSISVSWSCSKLTTWNVREGDAGVSATLGKKGDGTCTWAKDIAGVSGGVRKSASVPEGDSGGVHFCRWWWPVT
mmetsp:Transcript_107078/g.228664  ORF Transcript_107078/g.228664 Transcript_107078/m.228664 type:complete len:214 (-) Transcript_107078:199-840(-)